MSEAARPQDKGGRDTVLRVQRQRDTEEEEPGRRPGVPVSWPPVGCSVSAWTPGLDLPPLALCRATWGLQPRPGPLGGSSPMTWLPRGPRCALTLKRLPRSTIPRPDAPNWEAGKIESQESGCCPQLPKVWAKGAVTPWETTVSVSGQAAERAMT